MNCKIQTSMPAVPRRESGGGLQILQPDGRFFEDQIGRTGDANAMQSRRHATRTRTRAVHRLVRNAAWQPAATAPISKCAGEDAAVDREDGTGDVIAGFAAEENGRAGQFSWIAPT